MKIAQIVVFYFGPRRIENPKYTQDKLYYLKEQLKSIKTYQSLIKDYYYVFNISGILEWEKDCYIHSLKLIKEFLSDNASNNYKITVLQRKNEDGSYGGWEEALQVSKDKHDYTVLLEDDYIPYSDNYDEKLMSFFNDPEDVPPDPFNINNLQENLNTNQLSHPFKTCYVTQLFRHMHCSMSCGMISNSAYREINNEYGFGFMLHRLDNGAYGFIEQCQRGFLNKFIRQGYIIRDLHRKYYSPFLNHEGKIVKYGVPDGEALIAPIYPPFVGVADEEILYLDDPERL